MTLDLLYLEGCPNHEKTVDLVHSVLEAEATAAELRQILIRNREEAEAHDFPGSPTLRVNGIDIEAALSSPLSTGYACRTYLVDGKPQGVPPRSLVVNAIRAAREQAGSAPQLQIQLSQFSSSP